MKSNLTVTATVLGALSSYVSAHMNLAIPQPYNPAPVLDPLKADGSNYPCQKTSTGFVAAAVANATVGSKVQMTFKGSATHNGGSCQVSLSKDGAAGLSTNSQFKVIYSIIGGCPGVSGNVNSYDIPIPQDVPAGDYTYAWSWYNNIGNREFYMNCAPITISGGTGTETTFNALPDMAIYNLPSKNSCKTVETFDVEFPNPGKYVVKSGTKLQAPSCSGGSTGGSAGNSGGAGSVAAGSVAPAATSTFNNGLYTQASSAAASKATVSSAAASSGSLVVSPIASSPAQAKTSQAAPLASTSSIIQSPSSAAPLASSAAGTVTGTACSPDGAMVCSADGTQFALCNWGKANFQAVAAGTKCANGAILKRDMHQVLWRA